MSKKLFSTNRWKAYLKSRQRAQERNAKRRHKRARFRVYIKRRPKRRFFYHAVAPETFSIVQNPIAAIDFLNTLHYHAPRYNLTIDLSNVKHLTSDAIAALVATLPQLNTYVRGNLPIETASQKMLVASGFFSHVRRMEPLPKDPYGQISQERSKQVQPDLAKELIHFGTRALGKEQKCNAAYRVLIESMLNTHNHAAQPKRKEQEQWWATVYADRERKRVCFTFVDTGVGIFQSVRLGKLRSLYRRVRITNDAKILRDMLHGKVESSTGIPYRGKGLPAIFKLSESDRIHSLVIVANDVYGNVSSGEYKIQPVKFIGTLLYWEIEIK